MFQNGQCIKKLGTTGLKCFLNFGYLDVLTAEDHKVNQSCNVIDSTLLMTFDNLLRLGRRSVYSVCAAHTLGN